MKLVAQRLPAEGTADRQRPAFQCAAHGLDGALGPARASEDDEGTLRLAEQAFHLGHLGGTRPGLHRREGQGGRRLDRISQHVLRQGDDHRAGAAGGRGREGAGDQFWNARGIVDLDHPFGDRAVEGAIVDLLERLAFPVAARDLADEEDHRVGILPCDVHAGGRIGGAGAAGDEADAGATCQPALAVGHHGRTAFLPADDVADLRIVQRVKHSEIALARHRVDALDAVRLERLDDQLSAGLHAFFFSSSASISLVCSPRRGEGRS